MNFEYIVEKDAIKVYIVNPLAPSSQLLLIKILSGEVFGTNIINLNLLVSDKELKAAGVLKCELEKCAFTYTKYIKISTEIPRAQDADIICIMSDLQNPNIVDIESMRSEILNDVVLLLINLATNLARSNEEEIIECSKDTLKFPILFADGLVLLNILMSLSSNLRYDRLFCPSPFDAISKSVLGEYLNVQCNQINNVLVWGANDKCFHVEVEKPLIVSDKVHNGSDCDTIISRELLHSLKLDYTQFNSTWMRKEFLEKVASSVARNPYGCIYKAAEFAKSLKQIWKARSDGSGTKVYSNMGVISDGSIGTMKGYPYFLPLVLTNDSWEVNECFKDSTYLRQEIKRFNEAVLEQREKLIPYCKKILKQNEVNLVNMSTDNEGSTICDDSSSHSLLREQYEQ